MYIYIYIYTYTHVYTHTIYVLCTKEHQAVTTAKVDAAVKADRKVRGAPPHCSASAGFG